MRRAPVRTDLTITEVRPRTITVCDHKEKRSAMHVLPAENRAEYSVKCPCGCCVILKVDNADDSSKHMKYAVDMFNAALS